MWSAISSVLGNIVMLCTGRLHSALGAMQMKRLDLGYTSPVASHLQLENHLWCLETDAGCQCCGCFNGVLCCFGSIQQHFVFRVSRHSIKIQLLIAWDFLFTVHFIVCPNWPSLKDQAFYIGLSVWIPGVFSSVDHVILTCHQMEIPPVLPDKKC